MAVNILTIIKELEATLSSIDEKQTKELIDCIQNAKRIFVAGCGRSGLMARGFAMRLMHMGKQVYVVGEIVTPSIQQGDLLLIVSGSGETESLVAMAKKAKRLGATIATVTIFPKATIGTMADAVAVISAPTAKSDQDTAIQSIQPMGSLFEQSVLLYLDYVILCLMEENHTTSDIMFRLHANLE